MASVSVEVVDIQDYPPFRLGKSKFDQSTFSGRFRHFLDHVDPRTLFTTQAKLDASVKLLDDYKNGTLAPGTTNEQLWQAQKIKQAILHPDTGEKILLPFRMSGFIPFGVPVITGVLQPNLTVFGTIFWQWLAQSHMAGVNYANRNARTPTSTSQFLLGYTGAVTTACAIALGLNKLIKKASIFSPTTNMLIQRFVPFPAIATASVCNVLLMRLSELETGIDVQDKDGKIVGTSKLAARQALHETSISRILLRAPILLVPPIVMTVLERTRYMKSNPRLTLPLQVTVVTLAHAFALPMAISLFPQISKVSVQSLEPEIQAATSATEVFYNKGL